MIQKAEEDDILRILEIEQDAISPPWSHGGLLSEVYREDSFFALAVDAGTILGFVILRLTGDDSELLQIAVSAANRRCGVADLLMESALGWAHECVVGSIYLEVRKSNDAAVALYKKHGFEQVGVRRDYYTDPVEDALIFEYY